jgi:photosystem II stability/assembly factor-like uncharacterized protein
MNKQNPWFFYLIVFALLASCAKDEKPDENPKTISAWAVGAADSTSHALLLYSNDGGHTWQRQLDTLEVLKNNDLSCVHIAENGTVWVAGSKSTLLKTSDQGKNWHLSGVDFVVGQPDFSSVSSANGIVWVSCSGGFVIHSRDEGANWIISELPFFNGGLVQGITAVNDRLIFAVGGKNMDTGSEIDGAIAVSRDGGTQWEEVILPDNYGQHEWIGVKHFGDQNIVVHGEQGHYTYSTDAGYSWTNDSVGLTGGGGAPPDINGLTMMSGSAWWAALDYDHVLLTSNSGSQWTDQGSAGAANMFLLSIAHANSELAIAAGSSAGWPQSGKIIRTSDAGLIWEEVYATDASLFGVAMSLSD